MVNFSDNSDLRGGLKASLRDFWDRDISRLRYLRFVTNWLWKIFNISSSASDRSPVFSRRNRSLYLLCHPLKLSEDQVHYFNVLGPRGLSAFNFQSLCERCCEAIKLKLAVSFSDSFEWEKSRSSLFLKEICENPEIQRQMMELFSMTVALLTNTSRNRVDVKI